VLRDRRGNPLTGRGALGYMLDAVLNSGEALRAMRERLTVLPYEATRIVWKLAPRQPNGRSPGSQPDRPAVLGLCEGGHTFADIDRRAECSLRLG
jgi:hypothetical protein